MGEEDGGSDRPKVNNSAARPKLYAAWTLKWVEERDFRSRAPTALQVGSRKGDFFCWPSKIKYPAVIYTTFLILSQSQIIAHKPSLLSRFFHETQQFFWGFWNNQNQWFFHSDFFSHTQNRGCLVLISSNPQNRLLAFEFLNYLELVFIKKNQMPTQHWILNYISFAHLYREF